MRGHVQELFTHLQRDLAGIYRIFELKLAWHGFLLNQPPNISFEVRNDPATPPEVLFAVNISAVEAKALAVPFLIDARRALINDVFVVASRYVLRVNNVLCGRAPETPEFSRQSVEDGLNLLNRFLQRPDTAFLEFFRRVRNSTVHYDGNHNVRNGLDYTFNGRHFLTTDDLLGTQISYSIGDFPALYTRILAIFSFSRLSENPRFRSELENSRAIALAPADSLVAAASLALAAELDIVMRTYGRHMQVVDAQREIRQAYVGGFMGQLVSGVLWLASAVAATWGSPRSAIVLIVVGGVFIFPLTRLGLTLTGHRVVITPGNPLNGLAIQVAFTLGLSLPVVGAAALYRLDWFYPAFMIVLGAHYLPFIFIYGMRMYAGLSALLVSAGVVLALYVSSSFAAGAWLTSGLLLLFAAAGRLIAVQEARDLARSQESVT